MKQTVLVPIADGIEEIETICIIDVLRRGNLSVRVSSIEERQITGAWGIKLVADSVFLDEAIEDYDAIILPGGSKGAQCFSEYTPLINALKNFIKEKKLIGAICASPSVVFAKHGFLDNTNATCYPSLKGNIKKYQESKVVYDNNIITSQGPGTAIDFALKILDILANKDISLKVAKDILFK